MEFSTSCQYLINVICTQERIEEVNCAAMNFAELDHFDAPTITAKKDNLNDRYQSLQVPRKTQWGCLYGGKKAADYTIRGLCKTLM